MLFVKQDNIFMNLKFNYNHNTVIIILKSLGTQTT